MSGEVSVKNYLSFYLACFLDLRVWDSTAKFKLWKEMIFLKRFQSFQYVKTNDVTVSISFFFSFSVKGKMTNYWLLNNFLSSSLKRRVDNHYIWIKENWARFYHKTVVSHRFPHDEGYWIKRIIFKKIMFHRQQLI